MDSLTSIENIETVSKVSLEFALFGLVDRSRSFICVLHTVGLSMIRLIDRVFSFNFDRSIDRSLARKQKVIVVSRTYSLQSVEQIDENALRGRHRATTNFY
jgi:hypothetical protein